MNKNAYCCYICIMNNMQFQKPKTIQASINTKMDIQTMV